MKILQRTWQLTLGMAMLVACAPASPATQSSSPQTGAPAPAATTVKQAAVQKFNWADSSLGASLDPHAVLGRGPRRFDIFEALVAQDAGGTPTDGMLAKSWKSLDATTWQFVLFPDSKFHDGSTVTANDVKFSFDRALNTTPALAAKQRIPTVKEVRVVDPTTVNIITAAPDPIFLRRVAAVAILPQAAFEKIGEKQFALQPVGSGPYKPKEFVPNDHVTLVPFSEHPRRKGKLTEVVVKNVPDTTARIAGLRSGDLDYSLALPFANFDQLQQAGLTTLSVEFGQSGGFKIEPVADSPFTHKEVRQALNYAIDKDAMVKQIYRGYTKVEEGQILQPEVFGFNPNLKAYPYDPKKAKELLALAGYPNGFKTKIEAYYGSRPETKDIGLLIQSQLRDIGIEAEYNPVADFSVWFDKFYGKTDRGPILGTGLNLVPAMDADFGLVWFKSTQPDGLKYFNNPEFDQVYDTSTKEMDESKRKQLIWRASEILREEAPYLFTVQAAIGLAHSKKVQGIEKRFDQDPWLEKVWISE